jgi:hypothetical protein
MKKIEITSEYIMDYWLMKGHGITCEWLIDHEPELIKTPAWYKKYSVSSALHDEWYEWAITTIAKHYGYSRKRAKRAFDFDYVNVAPSIKKDEHKD